jgi:N,N'-diacetyllegionaminate synthase
VARRGLVAARDIEAGETFTEDLIVMKRPGTGLPPARRPHLLGRKARIGIRAGTLLSLDMVS